MHDRLARLYRDGLLDDDGLDTAVAKGWITSQQATEIRDR